MGHKFSALSEVALSATKKLLAESPVTDEHAYVTGQGILDYLIAEGYLTQTEIEALASLVKVADFTVNESVMKRNSSGVLQNALIKEMVTRFPQYLYAGFLITPTSSVINIAAGQISQGADSIAAFVKGWAAFAEGNGSGYGCLASSALVQDSLYYVKLIYKTATPTIFDYYVSTSSTAVPAGWTLVIAVGSFVTDATAKPVSESVVYLNEILTYGGNGQPYQKDYCSEITVERTAVKTLTISPVLCRDSLNKYNLRYYSEKIQNLASALGSNERYYLFLCVNTSGIFIYQIDTDLAGGSLTGVDYWRAIAVFSTDSAGEIIPSSIITKTNDQEKYGIVDLVFPLGTLTTEYYLAGYYRSQATGLTATYATDFTVGGWNVGIYIKSITGAGNITLTGVSIDENTGAMVTGDTETIGVATALQTLVSTKRWMEITNVAVSGVTEINYDIRVYGTDKIFDKKFTLLGYKCDMVASTTGGDIRVILRRTNHNQTSRLYTTTLLEDIGVSSGSATNQIIDNIRTTRTLNPAIAQLMGIGYRFHLEQKDFNDYFTSDENVIDVNGGYGLQVLLQGNLAEYPANITYINLRLLVKFDREL